MHKFYLTFLGLFCLLLLAMGNLQSVLAQATSDTVSADDVNRIASELWCPLCSGVRLDACELKACAQMREEIAIKLEAGEDSASIKQYFLERYGEQVLGAPQRKGWGWLAWLVPPIVVVFAGALLFARGRALIKTPITNSQSSMTSPKASDKDEQQLNEELARYE